MQDWVLIAKLRNWLLLLIGDGQWIGVLNVHVPVLNNGCKDRAMWVTNLDKKIEYETRVVWKDMRSNGSTEWKDLVWFPQNIPRHSFVIWLAIK